MYSGADTSVSEDINSFHDLSVDPDQRQCTSGVDRNTVNDIGTGLIEFLNIRDDDEQKQAFSFISSNNSLDGVEIIHDICEEHQHFDKCLTKSATLPRPVEIKNEGDTEGGLIAELITENAADAESFNPYHSCSKSLPAPSKLVSAMKGSREKHGTLLKKLNVTWAPDVYDPIPTAVSHALTNKSHRQHHHHNHHHRSSSNSSKKHSKSKQKSSSSKASRGSSSSGKDKKKQAHRATYGGGGGSSTSRCLKSLEEEERAGGGDFYETGGGAVDFDVGSSPDPYCGSSFLKKTVTELRFSVAEAT